MGREHDREHRGRVDSQPSISPLSAGWTRCSKKL
jgi:hypothetical protein